MKPTKKITYSSSGVNYSDIDPIKKIAQKAALSTASNLEKSGFSEISATRGESAYVWQQGNILMASVIEGLGTKNLVADAMKKNNKTYYDIVAHDTVATIINDLISVGAKPLSLHAYWAVGDSKWLSDKQRLKDLIKGWKTACNIAGVSWGGGETPAYAGIINPKTIDLAGSAVGIIKNKKNLLTDKKLKAGDRIIFIKSNGINANGLSLARALAKKLPAGYNTKLKNKTYGEALLTKSNIYANLVQELFKNKIDLHYLSNITGHGLRKVMRGRPNFTYVIEKLFAPQELFTFMQKVSGMNDYDMYQTFNMGQDYAIFVPQKAVAKTLKIIKQNKFTGLYAGYVQTGIKQVIIKPKNLVYRGDTLNLR